MHTITLVYRDGSVFPVNVGMAEVQWVDGDTDIVEYKGTLFKLENFTDREWHYVETYALHVDNGDNHANRN